MPFAVLGSAHAYYMNEDWNFLPRNLIWREESIVEVVWRLSPKRERKLSLNKVDCISFLINSHEISEGAFLSFTLIRVRQSHSHSLR